MKRTTCGQILFALCLAAISGPAGAVPTLPVSAAPSPNDLPPTHIIPNSPMVLRVRIWQAQQDEKSGEAALRAKDYKQAESDFRNAIDNDTLGEAYCGLAEALLGQGRKSEAMQTYRMIIVGDENQVNGANPTTRGVLEYAILLSQSGKWAEAVSAYQSAVQTAMLDARRDVPKYVAAFDPGNPQPALLETSAHIALGLDANSSCDNSGVWENDRAFEEYEKALTLLPASPLTNFYYGYGWQNLDPKDRAKLAVKPGQREAVKAALEKAAKLGTGDVQTEAKKELQRLR